MLDQHGRPAHSWRVLLYADIDPDFRMAYNFNEPWDTASNIRFANSPPSMFCCEASQNGQAGYTSYLALVDGSMPQNALAQQSSQEGLRTQIFLVEVPNSRVRWTEPRDISEAELHSFSSGAHPGGVAVLSADRRVRRVPVEELAKRARKQ